jgi:hypothetical protein
MVKSDVCISHEYLEKASKLNISREDADNSRGGQWKLKCNKENTVSDLQET